MKRNVFIYLMSMSRSISTGPEGELIRVASVGLGATIEGGAASQQAREWLSTLDGGRKSFCIAFTIIRAKLRRCLVQERAPPLLIKIDKTELQLMHDPRRHVPFLLSETYFSIFYASRQYSKIAFL